MTKIARPRRPLLHSVTHEHVASVWAPCRSSARTLTVRHLEAQRQLEALLPRRRRATPGVCEQGLSILNSIRCGSRACWTDLDRLGKARSRAPAPTPGGSPASFVRARRRSPWCQTRAQPPPPGPQARGPPERSEGAATSATSSPRRSSSSSALLSHHLRSRGRFVCQL